MKCTDLKLQGNFKYLFLDPLRQGNNCIQRSDANLMICSSGWILFSKNNYDILSINEMTSIYPRVLFCICVWFLGRWNPNWILFCILRVTNSCCYYVHIWCGSSLVLPWISSVLSFVVKCSILDGVRV